VGQEQVDTALFNRSDGIRIPAGTAIFRDGDPGDAMYVVQSGAVELRVGERVVETVTDRGMFGEMALIDNAPRTTTAVAIEDSVLIKIDQRQFMFMLRQTPFFAISVMRLLTRRLRAMDAHLAAT
jgi:CRP-like cAMP-binding protein